MNEVSLAIELLTAILANASKIATLVQEATASGATTLTADQWSVITGNDDSAEAELKAAIDKAKAGAA